MLREFPRKIGYDDPLEICLAKIESLLLSDYKISKRALSLLLLQEDKEILDEVREKERERINEILNIIQEAKSHYSQPLSYIISIRRQEEVSRIANSMMAFRKKPRFTLRAR